MTKSFKLNNKQIEIIKNKLKIFQVKLPNNPNLLNFYQDQKTTISLFKTGTLLIQGTNIKSIQNKIENWLQIKPSINHKNNSRINNQVKVNNYQSLIGCDESGVGDYFGGLTAAAVFIKNLQSFNKLINSGIKDSKKIANKDIKKLIKIIKANCYVGVCDLDAKEYNQLYDKYQNSHIIKTYAHTLAVKQLRNQHPNLEKAKIILDQFANAKKLNLYIEKLNLPSDYKTSFNILETQAESKYLQVACASIIARDLFLKQLEKLQKNLKCPIPLGSSNKKQIASAMSLISKKFPKDSRNFLKKHFQF